MLVNSIVYNHVVPWWMPMQLTNAGSVTSLRLGSYVLGKRLGGGGMGDVFAATHALMKSRPVAVKVLKPHLTGNAHFVQRFLREIEALAGIKPHPNLIRVEYADFVDGIPYLVMEFVEGMDLEQILKNQGPLSDADACGVICQAALGLTAIDAAHLVHRDLKPSNLMLTKDGVVKILDLGLARLRMTDEARDDLTPSHCLLGTMDYMAPEQAENPKCVDIRADIYSLGCTLFKLLTGRAPFGGLGSAAKKMEAHAHFSFPSLPDSVRSELREAIGKMTAKLPGDRYLSPADLVNDLAALSCDSDLAALSARSANSPMNEVTIDFATRVTQDRATVEESPSAQVPPKAPRHNRRRWQMVAFAVAVAAAIGAGAFALSLLSGPAVPIVRELDSLEPFLLHPLLDRAPVPIVWNRAGGDASFEFDAKRQQLAISFPENAMFQLGNINSQNFTFQISIKQTMWTSGTGIFWGYRNDELPNGSNCEAVFQFLAVTRRTNPDRFFLVRGRGEVVTDKFGQRRITSEGQYESPLDDPIGEQILIAKVFQDRLHSVTMQGKGMERIVSREANEEYAPIDYRGRIGTINVLAASVYRNASIKLEPTSDN